MVTVNNVIFVTEDRKASGRSGLETDLFSHIVVDFSFLRVTLAKCFSLGVWRRKLSSVLLGNRSDYLLVGSLLINLNQLRPLN